MGEANQGWLLRALGAGWKLLRRLTLGAISFLFAGDLILKIRARRRRREQLLALMGGNAVAGKPPDTRTYQQLAAAVREVEEEIATLEAELQYARALFRRRA